MRRSTTPKPNKSHRRKQDVALRAAGKLASFATVAIMRKLVIIANAQPRENRKWTLEAA